MSKKQKRFSVNEWTSCVNPKLEDNSNAQNYLKLLKAYIDNNDTEKFKTTLRGDFVYSGNGLKEGDIDKSDTFYNAYLSLRWTSGNYLTDWRWRSGGYMQEDTYQRIDTMHHYSNYKSIYRGGHHTKTFLYEYYYTKPLIEALFFEYKLLFRELVSYLAKSNNSELHKIFVETYSANVELPQEIFTQCNDKLKSNLETGIKEIKAYGDLLTKKGVSKGSEVDKLATKLNEKLNFIPDDKNIFSKKVKSLDYKFSFLKELHSSDPVLNVHREWKRVVSNVAAFIFSGPILHLIHFCVTGNFLFFNNTRSQSLVKNVGRCFKSKKMASS